MVWLSKILERLGRLSICPIPQNGVTVAPALIRAGGLGVGEIGMPKTDGRPDYKRAVAEARRLLDEFGFEEPPINPVRIARELGTDVCFVGLPQEHQNVSGFYDTTDNTIFVNEEEFPKRQTFTVAHELGHKVLHSEWAASENYKVLLRDSSLQSKDPIEQEANAFAAHLLVPRSMLLSYRKVATIEELSELFAVSMPVVRNRLKFELGE